LKFLKRALIAILIGFLVLCLAFAGGWIFSVTFQERILIGLSLTGEPHAQYIAAEQLRDYPSRASVIALIFQLNRLDREEEFEKKTAYLTLNSICLLTGHSFGSWFEKHDNGFSSGSLSDKQWSTVMTNVNLWSLQTFGADALGAMAGLLPNLEELKEGMDKESEDGMGTMTITIDGEEVTQEELEERMKELTPEEREQIEELQKAFGEGMEEMAREMQRQFDGSPYQTEPPEGITISSDADNIPNNQLESSANHEIDSESDRPNDNPDDETESPWTDDGD